MQNMIISVLLIAAFISIVSISGCTDVSGVDNPDSSDSSAINQKASSCNDDFVCNIKEPAAAQVKCPFGTHDDPYPGDCGRYIDKNNDGICDLSQ